MESATLDTCLTDLLFRCKRSKSKSIGIYYKAQIIQFFLKLLGIINFHTIITTSIIYIIITSIIISLGNKT